MSHWPVLPVLVPLAAAVACLLSTRSGAAWKRTLAAVSVATLCLVAGILLVRAADGTIEAYPLGGWPAPYGIVLVVDRLSAMMVALVAALAVPVLAYATCGLDEKGPHFHALLQLQIAGLNGAFLTGDLFNLFVFFEILLLASYALLVHGGGPERLRAGLAYVVLNLAGSALFLIALGLLYGTLGTLTLADLALVLAEVEPSDQALVRTAAALLVSVFLLKAALLPLSLWLPRVYAAADAPVAALFAVLTKVGAYALMRLSAVGLAAAPFTEGLLDTWLTVLALLTIAAGTIGAVAAARFAVLVANLVVVSTGVLLAAAAAGDAAASGAALYYLLHSTLVAAGLFLLGDAIGRWRGRAGDVIAKGPGVGDLPVLGGAFLVLGLAVSGIPPLSGFIGKVMLMQSLREARFGTAIWVALLASGLVAALVLARAVSAFFWEPGRAPAAPDRPGGSGGLRGRAAAALVLLVAASPLLTLMAAPVGAYAEAAALQLNDRRSYVEAVLGPRPDIRRERRP